MWLVDAEGNLTIPITDTLDFFMSNIKIGGVTADWNNFSEIEFILKENSLSTATVLFTASLSNGKIDASVNGELLVKQHLPDVAGLVENKVYSYDMKFTSKTNIVTTWLNNKKFRVIS